MDEVQERQQTYDGTLAWHSAGYKGKGINVWHVENDSEHALICKRRVLDAAPEANVIIANNPMRYGRKKVEYAKVNYMGKTYDLEEFIKLHNIHIRTQSLGGGEDSEGALSDYLNNIKHKYTVSFFSSAGNDGAEGAGAACPYDVSIWVGACYFKKGNNNLFMKSYSGVGSKTGIVDFSDFPSYSGHEGTSFAAPYLAGKAALVMGRYGRMSQDELYEYFRLCSEPIDTTYDSENDGIEGYDRLSGYGIVRLPDPNKKYIMLRINNPHYFVDGELVSGDVAPFIYKNRTYVPLRFVSETLGAMVLWNDARRSVTIVHKGKTVYCEIGSNTYCYDGEYREEDAEPIIRNNRTMVPVRFIAEALGCKVGWVESERKVLILEG